MSRTEELHVVHDYICELFTNHPKLISYDCQISPLWEETISFRFGDVQKPLKIVARISVKYSQYVIRLLAYSYVRNSSHRIYCFKTAELDIYNADNDKIVSNFIDESVRIHELSHRDRKA